MPNHQVIRFQMIAPISAARTVPIVTTFTSTCPEPIVLATAVPINAPIKLHAAASAMAWRGVRTLVDTTVAIALAASWKPLMYSKASAASKTRMKSSMERNQGRPRRSGILQRHVKHDRSRVPAAIDALLDQFKEILEK